MDTIKKYWRQPCAVFLGIIAGLLIIEIILRIHNPLPLRIKHNRITLPANLKYIISDNKTKKIDREVFHTKNSLGFRGRELPHDFKNYLSIITVGGSTMESVLISDDKTWPFLLEQRLVISYRNVWLNNAGLAGHSTFGHRILLENYLIGLKPKIIIFLFGINDVGVNTCTKYDKIFLRNYYATLMNFLSKHSELFATLAEIKNMLKCIISKPSEFEINLKERRRFIIADNDMEKTMQEYEKAYIPDYKKRISTLIELCRDGDIEPIFLTQPLLVGKSIDPSTGEDLETVEIFPAMNGKLYWKVLELYNSATKETCSLNNVYFIDLANMMSKDSKYFYDFMHFTNEGSEKVAEIVYGCLKKHLDEKYKDFIR